MSANEEPTPPTNATPGNAPAGSTPATVGPPRVIAFMNQKGGVGKTTTTVNMGAALALRGRKVLLIDMDPQAHLTLHLGIDSDSLERSVYDVLVDPAVTAASALQKSGNLALLPAEVNLAGVESELATRTAEGAAQAILRDKVAPLLAGPDAFDYVLIDCPPSLGLLTINALTLAREVFVPMQAHFLALQGLSKLLETVALVNQAVNKNLRVTGIVLCMHESQTLLANEVLGDIQSFLEAARTMDVPWRDARLLQPAIRRNIKLAESPSFGKSIFDYAPWCPGASDYKALAEVVDTMA